MWLYSCPAAPYDFSALAESTSSDRLSNNPTQAPIA